MKNYYEILEVDKNASNDIIKVAYKSLVKKYHPDVKDGHDKKASEEKIKQINDAYDINISAKYLLPENFNSVKAIYALIEKLKEE